MPTKWIIAAAALLAIPVVALMLTVGADSRSLGCQRGVYDQMNVQVPSAVQVETAKARCK